MNQELKSKMIKSIDITRESARNSLEIALESYTEVMSKLDFLAYLILNEEKKSSNA